MSLSERAGRAGLPRPPARIDQWIHSAVDLGAGRVITTALAGPPTAEERVAALSQLAPELRGTTFGEPLVRLTAQTPYFFTGRTRELPRQLCFLDASNPGGFLPEFDIVAPDGNHYGAITWVTDPGGPPPLGQRGMTFFFDQIPQLQAVVLSVPLIGQGGHVSLGYTWLGLQGPPAGEVSVAFPAEGAVQWLDVLFIVSDATGNPIFFLLNIEPDNLDLYFTYAALEVPSQVVSPQPPPAAP